MKDAESLREIGRYETYSQAHQDLFVRIMLGFKQRGIYVEVGAAEPKQSNNTYILERDLKWTGLSLDIEPALVSDYNSIRNNKCLLADATTFDFNSHFRENQFPPIIDYLSLDIDPAHITFKALENLPLSDYRFSIITYEHDRYTSGPEMMIRSRQLLENLGYIRVVSNVRCCGRDFEDWWVDPLIVSPQIYEPFISENIECRDIFKSV